MPKRDAFTLIELLVVLAIIGILIALILPAVQAVRSAASRVQCANNLRNIGLAAHHYHDTKRSFPPGMRWQNGKDPMRMSSWLTQLLGFVEQQPLWNAGASAYQITSNPLQNPPHTPMATLVPVFLCPGDGRVAAVQFAPRDQINVALTSYLGVSGKDWSTQDGVLFRDSRVRVTDITDGTSNTLLAGERPPSADFQFGWWYAGAGQKFTGSADMILGALEQNVLSFTIAPCPSGPYKYSPGSLGNPCDMFHFWSPHSGGANFLFSDGSARFISYGAAPVLPALASRASGETVDVP
jgi:prepilin-type N-terminal cleavage/methylation domain-containing protein/prepilin-type processing-associated H-X9-DG protein